MAGKGGARPGAGRKAKAEKYVGPVIRAEDRIADRLPGLIDKLFALADGVTVRDASGDGPAVEFYETPPNLKAICYLIDRVLGRPTQAVEHKGPGGGPIPVSIETAIAKIYGPPAP